MFQSSGGGGNAPASFNLPSFNQEAVRHILLGDYGANHRRHEPHGLARLL